jgi:glycosyltransferase involved in cell wall biosynthesis
MNIGIYASSLSKSFNCGLKVYCENLLFNLSKIDRSNDYYLFVPGGTRIPLGKNFHFVDIPNIPILKQQVLLPYFASKHNLDVFHFLDTNGSVIFKHPMIITTIPDLDIGQTYPLLGKSFINRITCEFTRLFMFKNTKVFLPISNFVNNELRNFNISKSTKSVTTVYLAPEKIYKINTKYINNNRYLLTMGDFAPRKNVEMAIEAYSLLPNRIKEKYPLYVVVSNSDWASKFKYFSKKNGVSSHIRILVNVSKSMLVNYYNNAVAFIYPSLYEGFGLPILEAMACGCPVVTSNFGAMKEISGDAAILVNPKSAKSIAKAVMKILGNISLKRMLVRKGIDRAKEFSWAMTARKTLNIYLAANLRRYKYEG